VKAGLAAPVFVVSAAVAHVALLRVAVAVALSELPHDAVVAVVALALRRVHLAAVAVLVAPVVQLLLHQ